MVFRIHPARSHPGRVFWICFSENGLIFYRWVVFALTTPAALIWVWSHDREQFTVAYHNRGDLIVANMTNAAAWVLYFLAIQSIEPVIAFTIFSGMIRITTTYLDRDKLLAPSYLDRFGSTLLVLGMVPKRSLMLEIQSSIGTQIIIRNRCKMVRQITSQ